MEKITLNGKRYISLGEFDHLCHNLVRDIYDKYEKGEDGQIHMTPEDVGAVAAYSHIRVEILHDELEQARTRARDAETLRAEYDKVYKKMRDEYIEGRYLIVGEDGDETIFFRKMCPYAPKPEQEEGTEPTDEVIEDDDTPVFTTMKRLAASWTDHYQAVTFCEYLKNRTKMDNLKVVPAWTQYMTDAEAKKLLDAIFRDDEEEDDGSGVGQTFSPD